MEEKNKHNADEDVKPAAEELTNSKTLKPEMKQRSQEFIKL